MLIVSHMLLYSSLQSALVSGRSSVGKQWWQQQSTKVGEHNGYGCFTQLGKFLTCLVYSLAPELTPIIADEMVKIVVKKP